MSRHDLDVSSLFTGLLLLAVGGGYLVADATDISIDGRWVLPTVLIALGLTGLAGSVKRGPRRSNDTGPASEPEPGPELEPDDTPAA